MGELPKQLLAWIARLLPKQENSGNGAVQVSSNGGHVTIVHLTQHVQPVMAPPPVEPIQPVMRPERQRTQVTEEQREVLAMMRSLPDEGSVLGFMQREFGTRRVVELQPKQLYRLRRYVETINRKTSMTSADGEKINRPHMATDQ